MRDIEQNGLRADAALLAAARAGDAEGVQAALACGADVNAEDASGRPAFLCALAGEGWHDLDAIDASYIENQARLDTLTVFLEHPAISLCTLNAPHQKHLYGVTPLGITAWLNVPDAVDVLLESEDGKILVDGADAYGATPLMYAARDGNLEVLQRLLHHGAKPDFRDAHHRTAIQFAASAEPEILWLCEEALRSRRAQDTQTRTPRSSCSPDDDPGPLVSGPNPSINCTTLAQISTASWTAPRPADDLIQTIVSNDLVALRALLPRSLAATRSPTPPSSGARRGQSAPVVLVNLPDARGWSAIHHAVCVQRPCVSVLDALYLAGADVSLFTQDEDRTLLHCLALAAAPPVHGEVDPHSFSPLYAFTMHLVRDLRAPLGALDRKGETCIHLAAERGWSIDVLLALLDCDVNGTVRAIKNSRGLTALEVARPQFHIAFGVDYVRPVSSSSEHTIKAKPSNTSLLTLASASGTPLSPRAPGNTNAMARSLLEALQNMPSTTHEVDLDDLDDLQLMLAHTTDVGHGLLAHLRKRAHRVLTELQRSRRRYDRLVGLVGDVTLAVEDRLEVRRAPAATLGAAGGRKRSESVGVRRRTTDSGDSGATAVSIGAMPASFMSMSSLLDSKTGGRGARASPAVHLKGWLDSLIGQIEPPSPPKPVREEKAQGYAHGERRLRRRVKSYSDVNMRANAWSWLKGKLRPEHSGTPPAIPEADQADEHVHGPAEGEDTSPEAGGNGDVRESLLASQRVLSAANRDLSDMERWITAGDELSSWALESISLAERVFERCLRGKRAVILSYERTEDDDDFSPPTSPASSRRSSFLTFPSSAESSSISLASTLTDADDQDLRQLRRLLARKIVARLDLAYEEADRLEGGIRVVRDLVRNVNRKVAAL